jgi:hypothetical protein
MQFKKAQRAELHRTWGPQSWFFQVLGAPAREIIECAYGLKGTEAARRTKCQEDVTLALSIFAQKIGCDKSHVTHALLTGSLTHLCLALHRIGEHPRESTLRNAWSDAFREVNLPTTTTPDDGV